ncbi:hypothetical protein AR685_16375 [Chryseobacterium sp. JAH]|nr:hypothetical protein AR685_16375 [Chryseobacterium sp. JAH]
MRKLFSIISILSFITIFSQSNETLISFLGYQDILGKPFLVEQFNNNKGITFNIDDLNGKQHLLTFGQQSVSLVLKKCLYLMS